MESSLVPVPPSLSHGRAFSQAPLQVTSVLTAYPHHPYVYTRPASGVSGKDPTVVASEYFTKCSRIVEDTANSIWQHVKTGPNIINTTWGRLSLGTKVLTRGGFEHMFLQKFDSLPNEKLINAYTCFLSTSAGPIAGTLFIATKRIAFASDQPLPHNPTPGQTMWSYYQVVIPVDKVKMVNAAMNEKNHFEKYIQIITIEKLEFWYMGFLNHEKALNCIEGVQMHLLA